MDKMDYSLLDESGLTVYLKDAVTIILENRPADPVQFLADYFQMVVQGARPCMRAYRYLRLCPRERDVFMDNLAAAFMLLDSAGGTMGMCGREYMQLLSLLCVDFPQETVHMLFQVLGKSEQEPISFTDFVGGVKACLLFEEFLAEAEELFLDQMTEEDGCVTATVLELLIKALQNQTQPDDRSRPGSRAEFADACRLARERLRNREVSETEDRISFPQFVAAIFRVLSPQTMEALRGSY